jgi:hypothetical protein
MDRISALRNIEDAIGEFEDGETDLATLEREVQGILRTYATEFEGELSAYRAVSRDDGADAGADGLVVLASSSREARERVRDLVADPGRFEVEAVE